MNNKEDEKSGNELQIIQEQQSKDDIIENIKSEFSQQYNSFFSDSSIESQDIVEITANLFRDHKTIYRPKQFYQTLNANLFHHSLNSKMLTFRVFFGRFELFVHILNESIRSPFHNFPFKESSREASIYISPPEAGNHATKCFHFAEDVDPVETFGKALRQICFIKIANSLKIGPKMNLSSFDLVVYENCIEFSMEQCKLISSAFRDLQKDIRMLKKKVSLLHYFKIAHIDIKPENIMYNSQNQLVLIDFGLSKMVKQPIGFKSMVSFSGSLNFCSLQMRKAFVSNSQFVDLYYNDVHCLQEAIQLFRNFDKSKKEVEISELQEYRNNSNEDSFQYMGLLDSFTVDYQQILNVKAQIYFQSNILLTNRHYRQILLRYPSQFMRYLQQFSYSRQLDILYNFITQELSSSLKDRELFVSIQTKKQHIYSQVSMKEGEEIQRKNIFKSNLKIEAKQNFDQINTPYTLINLIQRSKCTYSVADFCKIKTLAKADYFKYFIQIVDLRNSFSSFVQKRTVALAFMNYHKIVIHSSEIKYCQLEQCFKHILSDYLRFQDDYFQIIIPAAIINLVILEALSIQELIDTFQRLKDIQGDSLKVITTLLRSHFVIDWIQFKAISIYKEIDMKQLILKILAAFSPLIQKDHCVKLIKIIILLISSEKNMATVSESLVRYIINQKHSLFQDDYEIYQEVSILALYQMQKTNKCTKRVNSELRMILSLKQLAAHLFEKHSPVSYIHLRVYHQCKNALMTSVLSNIYQRFQECLQQPQIFSKFQMFYSFQRLQLSKKSPFQKLQELMQICDDGAYRYCYSVLDLFIFFLQQIKHVQQLKKARNKLKEILNSDFLLNIPFPKNQHLCHFADFFAKMDLVVNLFYYVYSKGDDQIVAIHDTCSKLQQLADEIVCKECQQSCFRCLKKINISIKWNEGGLLQATSICVKQLNKLKLQDEKMKSKIQIINQFIETLILILYHRAQAEALSFQKQQLFAFQAFKCYNLYPQLFLRENGLEIYCFISLFILQTLKSSRQYLNFHKKLLSFMHEYPCTQFIYFYRSCFQVFGQRHSEMLVQNTQQIVSTYLEQSLNEFTPNICLLIALMLRLIGGKSIYLPKIMVRICQNINVVSVASRIVALEYLFTFLFHHSRTFKNMKKKRSIILRYRHYITRSNSYSYFLSKIGLSKLRKKTEICYFWKLAFNKMQILYECLFS